jgi:hypothetical protein
VAGTVVGVVVAGGLVVAGPLRLPERRHRGDATAEFLAAWERSRRGTFVVRSRFTRRQADGATLSSPTELVQRPPDRLLRRFGGITGTIGGRAVSCSGDAAAYRCLPDADAGAGAGPPAGDASPAGTGAYDAAIHQELETFRSYVTPPAPGDRPLYRIVRAAEAGCFALVQQLTGYQEAPYGTDAQLCFDEATGALRSLRRHFDNGVVESEEAESITPAVTPADLGVAEAAVGAAGVPGSIPPATVP